MEPSKVWAGKFGDEYHQRNWVDWQRRVPFFERVLRKTGARSVYELGCGPGWNLSACKRAYPDVMVSGKEINPAALGILHSAGIGSYPNTQLFDVARISGLAELVFTAGCLIHIPPEDISETMERLIDRSYRYVMAIEYEADEETEIEYRGQSGLLWKRPYGEMYQRMGLKMIETAKLQQDVGFDNCRYWLMQK